MLINNTQIIFNIHVTEKQACKVLNIEGTPRLFIEQGGLWVRSLPGIQPIVVLSSGTTSFLNRDELLFMIGRELGHIKAGHLVLQAAASTIEAAAKMTSAITLGLSQVALDVTVTPLLAAWLRYAELTADRAGYLVCQDREVALRAMAKTSGYPPLLGNTVHPRLLAEQSIQFERELASDGMRRFMHINRLWDAQRPFTVVRTVELLKWLSDGYPLELIEMSTEERIRAQIWTCEDRALLEIVLRIQDFLSVWAVKRFGVRSNRARQIFRQILMQESGSAMNTELDQILQLSLEVIKTSSDVFEFTIVVLLSERGNAIRLRLPFERIEDWDQIPKQYRHDLIRNGGKEPLIYKLYSV